MTLGAPMEVLVWLSAITAFIGMLTHCNVEMRFGPLSWIFNTPVNIGINEYMPPGFLQQLAHPFRQFKRRKALKSAGKTAEQSNLAKIRYIFHIILSPHWHNE